MKYYSCFAIFLLVSMPGIPSLAQSSYEEEILAWHTKRLAALKAENGWLNLAGLFWLGEGRNYFGSAKKNKIVLPDENIDAEAGYLECTGNRVKLVVTGKEPIKMNGKTVAEAVIYDGDSTKPVVTTAGNLQWTIIRRNELIGVRLRNLKSPQLLAFKDIVCFAVTTR